jgi:hypothetical protein
MVAPHVDPIRPQAGNVAHLPGWRDDYGGHAPTAPLYGLTEEEIAVVEGREGTLGTAQ